MILLLQKKKRYNIIKERIKEMNKIYQYFTGEGTPIIDKKIIKWFKIHEEYKKEKKTSKDYIFDPFVGYIKR